MSITGFATSSTIQSMLAGWYDAGVFSYLLPFLLIFAVVFAIIIKLPYFQNNRAISAILGVVIGLLALQSPRIPQFFAAVTPALGMGILILLAAMIMMGLFFDPNESYGKITFFIIGLIIFVVIVYFGLSRDVWGVHWWDIFDGVSSTVIITIVFVVGVVAFAVFSNKGGDNPAAKTSSKPSPAPAAV